jgi:hypothetical protein
VAENALAFLSTTGSRLRSWDGAEMTAMAVWDEWPRIRLPHSSKPQLGKRGPLQEAIASSMLDSGLS